MLDSWCRGGKDNPPCTITRLKLGYSVWVKYTSLFTMGMPSSDFKSSSLAPFLEYISQVATTQICSKTRSFEVAVKKGIRILECMKLILNELYHHLCVLSSTESLFWNLTIKLQWCSQQVASLTYPYLNPTGPYYSMLCHCLLWVISRVYRPLPDIVLTNF